ncbi:MAG TPA: hypothetical protein VEV17_24790 [Bryobacteraceae bacterium]|nr:hypothetical protein [Bryobacteraceae bacterium]
MKRPIVIAFGLVMFAASTKAQPKVKSQAERDAFAAIENEKNPDRRIQEADDFVSAFKDSELKSIVLDLAAGAEELKGNTEQAISYAQKALSANQWDYQAMLLISGELARQTRDRDPDKAEKLGRAEKFAHDAIGIIERSLNPDPKDIGEARWAALKKDLIAQAHEDLGLVALVRGQADLAVAEFKVAVDQAATPDPGTMVRLAAAYDQAGKPENALAVLEKVLAMSNLNEAIRQFAENEHKRAQLKSRRQE